MFAAVPLRVTPPVVAVTRRRDAGSLPEVLQARRKDDQPGEGR
ncbi:hypothetical protein [Jatrophihabitans lederbergiae]|uniref:Uncharacterized protein n=1 Tax=Jatrophihabitans lederbergiae TaxID=3075547 RepID=A0ABU2JIA3_9ACTN|nr:hypothetical protein [Jatrophihabitans sp. DSM 44399]MDT0264448.1 hypothetical protein [Jatrophihabitans sp. DSM 44399]